MSTLFVWLTPLTPLFSFFCFFAKTRYDCELVKVKQGSKASTKIYNRNVTQKVRNTEVVSKNVGPRNLLKQWFLRFKFLRG